jgi:uncharacterized protein YecE (DUF72 family)
MAFEVSRDTERLAALARRGAYLGTSSWIYEGWRGQVYNGDYSGKRKDFVKTRFHAECLKEFSTVFPTTCFDGAYWRFPTYEQLSEFWSDTAPDFKMALKVTDLITVRRFRQSGAMGAKAGELNRTYLDHRAFIQEFLTPAQSALRDKLGPVIFEFSPFFFGQPFAMDSYKPLDFVKDLHKFLEQLPSGPKYAVEVRDPILVDPNFGRYIDCLEYHGVAHVLNEQTWMPELHEQMQLPGIFTTDYTVVRGLVRPGVSHESAVKEFSPYDRTQREMPLFRSALAELIHISLVDNRTIFAYLNNRLEGNSPNTISGVLDLFEAMDREEFSAGESS